MLLWLSSMLTSPEIGRLREIAAAGDAFVDGGLSSPGLAAAGVKRNEQLSPQSPAFREVAQLVVRAMDRNETFRTAALPKIIQPPILSRYRVGMGYGIHIDSPIRRLPTPMRLDLSITIFLSEPNDYDGGDLEIQTPYGEKTIKLPAGDAVLYPTTMLHRVSDITRGERLAAVTWIQSMVQDQSKRALLYELAQLAQWAGQAVPDSPQYHQINNVRANLVRMWATD